MQRCPNLLSPPFKLQWLTYLRHGILNPLPMSDILLVLLTASPLVMSIDLLQVRLRLHMHQGVSRQQKQ